MIEQRCRHGFLRSKVRCAECEGKVRAIPGSEEEIAERIGRIVKQVAEELGLTRDEVCAPRPGRHNNGVSKYVRAKAEVAKRARAKYGYTGGQIADALGVSRGDVWYALKRCG